MRWLLSLFVVLASIQTTEIVPSRAVQDVGRGTLAAAAWHPDGNIISVVGSQGIWFYTPEFVLISQHAIENLSTIAWKADGSQFATGSADGSIHVWDYTSTQLTNQSLVGSSASAITSLAWQDNILASGDATGTVHFWDTTRDTDPRISLSGATHLGRVNQVAWSSAGRTLASAGADGKVYLWDAESRQIANAITADFPVSAMAWNGEQLAVGGTDGFIYFWDTAPAARLTRQLRAHANPITSLDWRGDTLISVDGNSVKHWVNRQRVAEHSGRFTQARLQPNTDTLLVFGDHHYAEIISPDASVAALHGYFADVQDISWVADQLVSVGNDGLVRLWALEDPMGTYIGHTAALTTVVQRDGRVASGGADIRIWEAGQVQIIIPELSRDLEWNSNGLASAGNNVTVWDADTGNLLYQLGNGQFTAVAWGGPQLAAIDETGTVWIWDGETLLHQISAHDGFARSLTWNTNTIVTGGLDDGVLRIINPTSGEPIGTLNSRLITSIAWHPNDQWIAVGSQDGLIRIWDVPGRRVLNVIETRAGEIRALAWHPNGNYLATASETGRLILFQ